MKMTKEKCKILMLPSKEKTPIFEVFTEKMGYSLYHEKHFEEMKPLFAESTIENQNLYFLCKTPIGIGDWYLFNDEEFLQCNNLEESRGCNGQWITADKCIKLVATTDSKYKLPKPTEEFLEEYCRTFKLYSKEKEMVIEYHKELFKCSVCGASQKYEICHYPWPRTLAGCCAGTCYPEIHVNFNNEVFIHPIKENWTREEVEKLCTNAYEAGRFWSSSAHMGIGIDKRVTIETFLENNL